MRVNGRSGSWPGHTTDYDGRQGFLVCEPRFEPAELVTVDVLVGFDRETGIRLRGRVTHVARGALTDDERWGLAVVWQEAVSRDSSLGLARFLQQILGLAEARVREDGEAPYLFTFRFGDGAPARRAGPTTDGGARPAVQGRDRPDEESGARELLYARLGRPGDAGPQTGQRQRSAATSEEVVSLVDERRTRPRIALDTPVTWLTASTPHVGRARSISRSGIYVETEEDLPGLGERVMIRFPVPHAGKHQLVVLTTQVVRHKAGTEKPHAPPGFAAKYVVVDELGRRGVLQHFLESHGVTD